MRAHELVAGRHVPAGRRDARVPDGPTGVELGLGGARRVLAERCQVRARAAGGAGGSYDLRTEI